MSGPNPTTLFFLLIIFSIVSFKLSYCINFCPKFEKQSLLSFKQSLKDPSNKLSSWNINGEVNCCKWTGVVCNDYTGHVRGLHLQNHDLSGKINPSLLNLKHLRYLNLNRNDFNQTIPSFIGSFQGLEYLHLSHAGFYGTIPPTIGNLSNLRTLNLKSSYQLLDVDSLEWLSGLSQLEHLNMNGVNMSRATMDWKQVINTLSSLVELRFCRCSLNFIDPVIDVANISSLAILDLSENKFRSVAVPKWIFQLRELTFLDLSWNYFEGPIPSISNTTKLQYIDLSQNYFNSTISNGIANVSSLHTLGLFDSMLYGKIPKEFANMCKMKELELSANMFEGDIGDSFGNMSDCFLGTLESLTLWRNQLSGHVPDQFGEFKNLRTLSLSLNKLAGNLPQSLGKLSKLEYLSIRYNMLEGVVTESHFANMTKLKSLYASENRLTLKVHPNWTPPFKLVQLALRSWHLGGVRTHDISSWLDTKENVEFLDLSSTGMSGEVPTKFWEIQYLNLSHNHFHGKIPDISGPEYGDRLIYLSSNQFSGSLPRVGNTVTELDLSNNSFSGDISHFLCDMTNKTYRLKILHLGGNKLIGELPDCFMKWPNLKVLNLGNNNMYGSIPNSIGFLLNLRSLNLYGNRFSGRLPFSMHSCNRLLKIDLSKNQLDGDLPAWIGTSLPNLGFLILRSNKLSGKISSNLCHLTSLQILDLSDNKFFGIIPRCVNNFTAMATKRPSDEYEYSIYVGVFIESASVYTKGSEYEYDTILQLVININLSKNNFSGDIPEELTSLVELQSLNLSENHLRGSIPNRIGDMKQLESVDLSRNVLSGEIPDSFRAMSSLNHLNLSYNNLTGRIPESTQILGFDSSSFIGNNLCGPPLTSNCSKDGEVLVPPVHRENNEGDQFEIDWFYIFLSSGYAVGFSVVCAALIFKKSWRDAYFELLEVLWNKVYVYFCIKWRRFAER